MEQPQIQALAVLPFVNAGSDADTEYLSDGITESTNNNLSQIPKLRVMASSTVFSYKGKVIDPRQVGKDLGVDAVVTGSINQRGDSLVIRANLVNVADGTQLWGAATLIANAYAALGETDMAFEFLDKACDEKDTFVTYVQFYPQWKKLRSDPRYTKFLQRINLAP